MGSSGKPRLREPEVLSPRLTPKGRQTPQEDCSCQEQHSLLSLETPPLRPQQQKSRPWFRKAFLLRSST
ncbi:unnamed protein product [Caretta caretta]